MLTRARSIRRPLHRFAQVDSRRRALVMEAVASLLVARAALPFVPFSRLARRLGTPVAPDDPRASRARGDDKPLDAHAWLDAAGVEVTGHPVATRFAEIACFV